MNKKYQKEYFTSGNYKEYLHRNEHYKKLALELFQVLSKLNCKKVLDFGCAVGFLVKHLSDLGCKCVGYDVSSWAIDYGKKNFTDNITNQITVLQNKYDVVLFLDVLEHNTKNYIETMLSKIETKFIVVRIPVSAKDNKFFYFKESRLDKTHVTCMNKNNWKKLFAKCSYEEVFKFNSNYIWDSLGVYCAVLKKIR